MVDRSAGLPSMTISSSTPITGIQPAYNKHSDIVNNKRFVINKTNLLVYLISEEPGEETIGADCEQFGDSGDDTISFHYEGRHRFVVYNFVIT